MVELTLCVKLIYCCEITFQNTNVRAISNVDQMDN